MQLTVTPTRPWYVVEVEFQTMFGVSEGKKRYEYRTRFDLKVGDPVVVEVNCALKVVTVMAVKEPHQATFKGDLRWIVSKVDIGWYQDMLEEQAAIEREEQEIEQLAIQHRKIKAVKETFADNPGLQDRFNKLLERKKAL